MLFTCLSGLGALLLPCVTAQSTFTPARPPSLPLAVKSPYLSTWFPAGSDGGNGGYLPGQWPSFWTGQTTGWTGLIRVDGKTFTWMGAPANIEAASQVAYEYTSTRSIFTIHVDDKVSLTVTFLSPLTPDDLKRQSLTFSYVRAEVVSLDGAEHEVQLYTDISAEWVSGDVSAIAKWEYGKVDDIAYHRVYKQDQWEFGEVNDRAEWGSVYYATDAVNGTTSLSGADTHVRSAFVDNGTFEEAQDANFRAINDNWPVFAHAVELGSVGSSSTSTLFTIGLCQDSAIQFLGKDGLVVLPPLWKSYFADNLTALSFFHKDFETSSGLAYELDNKIADDSRAAAGEDYLILTTLAARQAFGAVQLVGTTDTPYVFLKEISSNGNTQTIDVIYPASPIFFYLNSEFVKLLLDPHFENQEAGHYPNKWAMHDLGAHYPNATGHTDGADEAMPIEECGNNIIMVLAYAQRSGNTDYLHQHYPILKQWAEYLVEDSLYPAEQLSTDDFAGHLANQTNLALKGMIGLEAMSRIATLVGESGDAQNFTDIAHKYIDQWMELGNNFSADPPHSILNYGNASTHGLLYNLYNDKLVSTNLVPASIYTQQSLYYPTVKETYGVPLDTRNRFWTKADWEVFCAAVASEETRDLFIGDLARWVGETTESRPFTDLYMTDDGRHPVDPWVDFKARPVVGGMFALLALQ
ncbi:glutaminase GtaA [Lophiostoma macrostomum CBS 122681]|uniref:Glutaminase GtaA n=1 Tax=Lophiostoma macrostomum CBS 122681 TaxID=1314788 RepID=A0A6A6TKH0_9PLEO|nr:glutaminase GtaA [Lophiostoma macrostomum CBS 122681]